MTANKRLNIWFATTIVERNALGTAAGVAVGDFCCISGVNLYMATVVNVASSTWRSIAGLPTSGPTAVGGRNFDNTLNRSVYAQTAVTFRAVLDAVPSSVTIAPVSNSNWPVTPAVIAFSVLGFVLEGGSNVIAPNAVAWHRGTYTISY